jgi:GT2 family glycosyltransferase
VYLDADDYFLPGFIEQTLAKTQECDTDALLVYTDWVSLPNNEAHKAEEWDVSRLRDHALFAVTFVHAKSAFEEIGGFDEDLELWEDWDYCIKLAMKGYYGERVPTPLFAYRYDTGRRREDSLDNKEALLARIRGKYAGAVPMPRRG